MTDLHFGPINESRVKLFGNYGIVREIADYFTFYVPGYKFQTKYKMGQWDGKIRPIHMRDMSAPKGLVPEISKLCKEKGYTISFDKCFRDFLTDIPYDISKFTLPFAPHDYQELAVKTCLKKKRAIIESSTGSGKSFMIYLLSRLVPAKKVLIITPRISLVTQLYSDFEEYSENDTTWSTEENCHTIHSGADKETDKRIVISTWQSIYKQPKKYFQQFDCIIGDEVHEFESKSCSGILDSSINAFYRFGFTGTLEDAKTHRTTLTGAFGPIHKVSSTQDLIGRGILANLEIRSLVIKHDNESANFIKGKPYKDEIAHIISSEARNKLVKKIAKDANGNSLVLVSLIRKHGMPIYKDLLEEAKDKTVHLIYGGTDADSRESIRQLMEKESNVIVIASMQLFSTGINIKNLVNVIFAHPTKSKIKILQSIGRGLRKHQNKKACIVWDIGDDLRGTRKTPNTTLKHFYERYKLYQKEGFNVKLVQINL